MRHQPDPRPQAVLCDKGDILPVNEDAPGFEVMKAQENADKRGFARARWPDEADLFARPDGHVQVFDQAAVPP